MVRHPGARGNIFIRLDGCLTIHGPRRGSQALQSRRARTLCLHNQVLACRSLEPEPSEADTHCRIGLKPLASGVRASIADRPMGDLHDGASCAGASDSAISVHDSFDVVAPARTGHVSVFVKSCKRCGRMSNSRNPFTDGPYAGEAFLPWGYGSSSNPGGNVCKALGSLHPCG